MNGVYRGGCYRSGKTFYVRDGLRGGWDRLNEGQEQIGFRLNGVYRGGAAQTIVSVRLRCAGNRYGDTSRHQGTAIIGFR